MLQWHSTFLEMFGSAAEIPLAHELSHLHTRPFGLCQSDHWVLGRFYKQDFFLQLFWIVWLDRQPRVKVEQLKISSIPGWCRPCCPLESSGQFSFFCLRPRNWGIWNIFSPCHSEGLSADWWEIEQNETGDDLEVPNNLTHICKCSVAF